MLYFAHSAKHRRDNGRAMRVSTLDILVTEWTSSADYEVEWPDEDETTLNIYYHPDKMKGLEDPRYRRLEYDLETGEYDLSDAYPWQYHFVFTAVMLIGAGGLFLLLRWGARGLQKTYEFDGRLAVKQFQSELSAGEMIARMKARE